MAMTSVSRLPAVGSEQLLVMGLYPMTHPVRGMLPLRWVRLQAPNQKVAVVLRLQREGSSLSHVLFLGRCPQAMLWEPFGLVLRVPVHPIVAVNGPRGHAAVNGAPDASWA